MALLEWLVALVLCGGALVAATDRIAQGRRSHFGLRLAVLVVTPFAFLFLVVQGVDDGVLPTGVARLFRVFMPLIAGPALMLLPAFLFRGLGPSGPSDGDGGGGGGPGPRPQPPATPRGGFPIPLPDAQQSRMRLRDHRRPGFRRARIRRPAREPVRVPARR